VFFSGYSAIHVTFIEFLYLIFTEKDFEGGVIKVEIARRVQKNFGDRGGGRGGGGGGGGGRGGRGRFYLG
jgi:hypothetical protein